MMNLFKDFGFYASPNLVSKFKTVPWRFVLNGETDRTYSILLYCALILIQVCCLPNARWNICETWTVWNKFYRQIPHTIQIIELIQLGIFDKWFRINIRLSRLKKHWNLSLNMSIKLLKPAKNTHLREMHQQTVLL